MKRVVREQGNGASLGRLYRDKRDVRVGHSGRGQFIGVIMARIHLNFIIFSEGVYNWFFKIPATNKHVFRRGHNSPSDTCRLQIIHGYLHAISYSLDYETLVIIEKMHIPIPSSVPDTHHAGCRVRVDG